MTCTFRKNARKLILIKKEQKWISRRKVELSWDAKYVVSISSKWPLVSIRPDPLWLHKHWPGLTWDPERSWFSAIIWLPLLCFQSSLLLPLPWLSTVIPLWFAPALQFIHQTLSSSDFSKSPGTLVQAPSSTLFQAALSWIHRTRIPVWTELSGRTGCAAQLAAPHPLGLTPFSGCFICLTVCFSSLSAFALKPGLGTLQFSGLCVRHWPVLWWWFL